MGYDMRTETTEPGEAEKVQAIRDELGRAYNEQREHDADELYKAMQETERSYFQLNVTGMRMTREAMHALGMLDTEDFPHTWPDSADYGVTPAMWDDWTGEPDENTPKELRAFLDAQDAVASAQRQKPTGIPVHKLGTNDDWLVTPDEIAAALERYATSGEKLPGGVSWWPDWIKYLRYAQDHGGFRVR